MDSQTKLARHDEVAIIRHAKVQEKRSPLNPDDQAYWETRRRRRLLETMRSPKRSALLRQQDCRCVMCGVGFDPDDDISFIDAHHDTRIASPEILPMVGVLSHVICSRADFIWGSDEADQHGEA